MEQSDQKVLKKVFPILIEDNLPNQSKMLSISYQRGHHVLYYQAESLKDGFDELEAKFKALHSDYKEKSRVNIGLLSDAKR